MVHETRQPELQMSNRHTRYGPIQVVVVGPRGEVLIPLVAAWSAHAERVGRSGG